MKKMVIKTALLAAALFSVTACSLDEGTEIDQRPIIDPPFEFHFVFDEEGVPYPYGYNQELLEDTQKDFREQVVGYGWEWVQTHEIQANGYPKIDDYYQGIYGIGPSHFYLESAWEAVEFYHSDATNKDVYRRQPIYIDPACGRIFFNPMLIEPPFTRLFDTFMLYNFQGTWHIVGVEYLGQRQTDGVMRDVWGWSEYIRMSPERLEEIQEKFNSEI